MQRQEAEIFVELRGGLRNYLVPNRCVCGTALGHFRRTGRIKRFRLHVVMYSTSCLPVGNRVSSLSVTDMDRIPRGTIGTFP